MYQSIREPVDVAGYYRQQTFTPIKFAWKNRSYPVKRVNATHNWKDGSVRKRTFSVESQGQVYVLEFNRDQETWTLQEVWVEEGV